MCPISLPFCIPYWIWVVLVLFGLSSFTAMIISAGVAVLIVSYALYKSVKSGRFKVWVNYMKTWLSAKWKDD